MLIERQDSVWWYKLNGVIRRAIALGVLNPIAEPVVLTEYPKSGGSWMSQMLSAALNIPYTRNRLPTSGSQIIHGCFLKVNRNIDTVVVWRDGRDTMISYYYHMMFDKPITSAIAGDSVRRKLGVRDPYDVDANLPRFIEWACTGGYPRFTWGDFINNWYDRSGVVYTSYEACLADPFLELKTILSAFNRCNHTDEQLKNVIEQHTFESQSNRKPGEEDVKSFIRKGIVGDWKNTFNREACEIFIEHCGKELILLGYAEDDSWIDYKS